MDTKYQQSDADLNSSMLLGPYTLLDLDELFGDLADLLGDDPAFDDMIDRLTHARCWSDASFTEAPV